MTPSFHLFVMARYFFRLVVLIVWLFNRKRVGAVRYLWLPPMGLLGMRYESWLAMRHIADWLERGVLSISFLWPVRVAVLWERGMHEEATAFLANRARGPGGAWASVLLPFLGEVRDQPALLALSETTLRWSRFTVSPSVSIGLARVNRALEVVRAFRSRKVRKCAAMFSPAFFKGERATGADLQALSCRALTPARFGRRRKEALSLLVLLMNSLARMGLWSDYLNLKKTISLGSKTKMPEASFLSARLEKVRPVFGKHASHRTRRIQGRAGKPDGSGKEDSGKLWKLQKLHRTHVPTGSTLAPVEIYLRDDTFSRLQQSVGKQNVQVFGGTASIDRVAVSVGTGTFDCLTLSGRHLEIDRELWLPKHLDLIAISPQIIRLRPDLLLSPSLEAKLVLFPARWVRKLPEKPSFVPIFYSDTPRPPMSRSPLAVSRLLNLIFPFSPLAVQVRGSDFYLGALDESETLSPERSQSVSSEWGPPELGLVHDPIDDFEFSQNLVRGGWLNYPDLHPRIFNMDSSRYSFALEEKGPLSGW